MAGIAAAQGILTAAGSRTSHAAVVARQLGKVCLVNCSTLRVLPNESSCTIGDTYLREGDALTLDADTGQIYPGLLAVVRERPTAALAEIAAWRSDTGAVASPACATAPAARAATQTK
jgi:pyruvate,orthophosphate dikinase